MLTKVTAPINVNSAIGKLLQDDEQLSFIEDEMMKVGSLSHGSIAWEKVKATAINILETKSKDIKVLSNLLQCLQQEGNLESTLLSIKVFSSFITQYWFDAYPVPGKKGEKLRQRYFKQIMQRSIQAVKKLDSMQQSSDAIDETLDEFVKSLESAEIEKEHAEGLKLAFQGLSQIRESDETEAGSADGLNVENSIKAAPDAPDVYFDAKNERATRQALFSMAYFLNQVHPKSSIGYRVRRHALWFSIWQLPQVKKEQVTELAAFSVDRFIEYQQKIETEPSIELLNKIERSIEQSPYWFDGHYLSYKLCKTLGFTEVTMAMKEELEGFISRFSQIIHYKAIDGSGFAGIETQKWLNLQDKSTANNVSMTRSEDWLEEYQQLQVLADAQGLSASLVQVNQQLKNAKDTRECFYWRLLNADLLNQQQLTSMAKNEYQVLLDNVKGMSIDDWEPSFSGHIKQSLDNMDQTGL